MLLGRIQARTDVPLADRDVMHLINSGVRYVCWLRCIIDEDEIRGPASATPLTDMLTPFPLCFFSSWASSIQVSQKMMEITL